MKKRIDANLNLVLTLNEGETHIFCEPLPRAYMETYWRLLAQTYADISNSDLGIVAGPAIAKYAMREAAKKIEREELAQAFFADVGRRTQVLSVTEDGMEENMLQPAIKRGLLTEDEADEVENTLVFFMCASRMIPRQMQPVTSRLMSLLRNVEWTLYSYSEWKESLRKSIEKRASEEKQEAAS